MAALISKRLGYGREQRWRGKWGSVGRSFLPLPHAQVVVYDWIVLYVWHESRTGADWFFAALVPNMTLNAIAEIKLDIYDLVRSGALTKGFSRLTNPIQSNEWASLPSGLRLAFAVRSATSFHRNKKGLWASASSQNVTRAISGRVPSFELFLHDISVTVLAGKRNWISAKLPREKHIGKKALAK